MLSTVQLRLALVAAQKVLGRDCHQLREIAEFNCLARSCQLSPHMLQALKYLSRLPACVESSMTSVLCVLFARLQAGQQGDGHRPEAACRLVYRGPWAGGRSGHD